MKNNFTVFLEAPVNKKWARGANFTLVEIVRFSYSVNDIGIRMSGVRILAE